MNMLNKKEFYFDLPLYTPIKITDENRRALQYLLLAVPNSLNAYNPYLKENTTYAINASERFESLLEMGGIDTLTIKCIRTDAIFYFYVHYDNLTGIFQKIGQFPSIADFHISQIKKYDKVLNKEKLKEFTRAIGLAANGVGIGSFVYLRRIFEGLIEEAHDKAKADNSWDEEEYLRRRMAEKIEMLQYHLPAFLVENKSLYSILSVGIHSLKEEDCLAYFDTVRVGIELILDEKVEQFEKQKKLEEAKQKLNALTQRVQENQKNQ